MNGRGKKQVSENISMMHNFSQHWNIPFPALFHSTAESKEGKHVTPPPLHSDAPYSLLYHLPMLYLCNIYTVYFHTKVALWLFKVHLSFYATSKEANSYRLFSVCFQYASNSSEAVKSVFFQPQEAVILRNVFCIFKILQYGYKTEGKDITSKHYFDVSPYTWLMQKAMEQTLKHSFKETL